MVQHLVMVMMVIRDKSNIYTGSYSYFCYSYQCPSGYTLGATSNVFLALGHTMDGLLPK